MQVDHELGLEDFSLGRLALIYGGRLPGTVYPWRLDIGMFRYGWLVERLMSQIIPGRLDPLTV